VVSRCSGGQEAVTKAAYLLFYRRRSDTPLGPPSLQKIVQKEVDPDSEEDSETENRSRSPAGNGLRLGGSSRNGSSRAGAAGAGVEALRGGGSALSAAAIPQGSLARSGAEAETREDNSPPGYEDDETYYEDEGFSGIDTDAGAMYGPVVPYHDEPIWSFDGLGGGSTRANDSDDVASDAPDLGSDNGEYLEQRMLEDFGDDLGRHPGASTPVHNVQPVSGGDDEEVKEIRIGAD
jgi:ubiquitin carboxyl-terminal hydrolase 4/11/15